MTSSFVMVIATLGLGIVAGWVGQRSRFCSIGGLRDFLLTRDTTLLRGLLALFVAAWIAYPLTVFVQSLQGPELIEMSELNASEDDPNLIQDLNGEEEAGWLSRLTLTRFDGLIFLAALGVGFFSLLVDGCPFRQHVMAGQGYRDARFYLIGFYIAALLFEFWSTPLLRLFL